MNQELKDQILKQVRNLLPDGSDLQERVVRKNNGVERLGVYLVSESDMGAAPIIYMEPMVAWAEAGGETEEIADKIAEVLLKPTLPFFSGDQLGNFDDLKSKIVVRLVQKAGNEEMLKKLVYREFLDLVTIPAILLRCPEDGLGQVLVEKNLLAVWQVDEEELFRLAYENSKRLLPEKLMTMSGCLRDLGLPESIQLQEEEVEDPMYVLTNNSGFFGASVILYGHALPELAALYETDLLILPCSVHELIIVPDENIEIPVMQDLVKEVNKEMLSPEEVLSGSVYRYERESREIVKV